MAASFPDCHKAKEGFHNLNLIKDNNVFKSIEQLLEEQSFTIGQAIQVGFLVYPITLLV